MNDYKPMFIPLEHNDFRALSKQQAEDFFQWYIRQSKNRIRQLCKYIQTTSKSTFCCNYTPESLVDLWNWFEDQICIVKKTEDEYQAELKQFPEWVADSISRDKFTVQALAIITDISFYFAETFIKYNPTIRWGYFTKPKNEAYVNMPVLLGFKADMKLDPRRVVYICAQKSSEQRDKNRLIHAYQTWAEFIEK